MRTLWAGMPGNEPKKEDGAAGTEPIKLPNVDLEGQLSLPSIPIDSALTEESDTRFTSQEQFQFDRKVHEYGEALKKELAANTKADIFGNLEWKPYRISVDHIPPQYHERVAHYLLQAYKLPEAERHVAYNAPVFQNLDRTGLAHALVARGINGVEALGENLPNFKGVDETFLLDAFLRIGNIWTWTDKLDFFTTMPHRLLVEEVLRDLGHAHALFHNFDKLRLSEHDNRAIVEMVLAGNQSHPEGSLSHKQAIESLVAVLHTMRGVDHERFLRKAVESSAMAAHAVGANLHRYPGIDSRVLADACKEALNDPAWSKHENARVINMLIDYFEDFSSLTENERAQRVLAINPDHVLTHINDYPSLSHLDVALANVGRDARDYGFFDLMDKLSLPTAEQKLALAEAIMDSPKYGCNYLLRHFEKFDGLDPAMIVEKILDRDPSSFLREGKFLGHTPSEVLVLLLKHGVPEDNDLFRTEEDNAALSWIRFGGHGREVADAFIRDGEGRLVVENLSCFTGLADTQVREAALQAVLWYVHQGKVDTARGCLHTHAVPLERLHQGLIEYLRVDFASQAPSPQALLRIAGVAAWSLYYPAIVEAGDLSDSLEPYRKLFGPRDSQQLEKNARQNFLENLVSRGVPMLIQLGWFRHDTLEPLSRILPQFLESTTGSSAAWTAHEMNLRVTRFGVEYSRRAWDLALRRARRELATSASTEIIHNRAGVILEGLNGERKADRRERRQKSAIDMAKDDLGSNAAAELIEHRAQVIFEVLEENDEHNNDFLRKQTALEFAERDLGLATPTELIEQRAEAILEWGKVQNRTDRGFIYTPFFADDGDPFTELTILRNFYKDFGILQAPALYLRRYRACGSLAPRDELGTDSPPPEGIATVASLKRELKRLHNVAAEEGPFDLSQITDVHLEYLSGWIRVRDPQSRHSSSGNGEILSSRIWRHGVACAENLIQPKEPQLTIRCMKVHLSSRPSTTGRKWTEALIAGYRRTREVVEQFRDVGTDALLSQEKNSVERFLNEQRKALGGWLAGAQAASLDPEKVSAGHRQLSQLEDYLKDLDKVDNPQQLFEFVCSLKGPMAEKSKGTVVRLALRLGLEGVSSKEEFLEALEPMPTEESVRRIYEFIANQVRDAALRPLEKNPKILRIAEKQLSVPEFKSALAIHRGVGAGSTGGQPRPRSDTPTKEILVLPTRGILAELAGYFSEACWTDKQDLMKDHPDATALIFLEKETPATDGELASGSVDLSDASLLGACYMLHVRDTEGNRVIAVRGINPRERECDRLDVESFIERLLDDVVTPYAAALGATKVVVPFDELGHAQTNRQLINEYLHRRYAESEYVPLDPKGPNSQFNDRLIFDKCRLVRLLSPRA